MIAWRATSLNAMFCGVSFGAAAITSAWRTRSGKESVHCSACMAPSEPPITAAKRSMPSRSARRAWASTQSSTVTTGKVRAPGLAAGRIDRRRAGRAEAAPEVVGADDEEAARVERLAGPDEVVPPADVGFLVFVEARHVMRRVQRVADEHGVRARGVQLAVGFIGDVVGGQLGAAAQRDRLIEARFLRYDWPTENGSCGAFMSL